MAFVRLQLYKPLVLKIIQINIMGSALAKEQYQAVLEAVLELLKKVHNVSCNMAKPELVGHDAFYMKELNDMIDIQRDYDLWQARRMLNVVRLLLLISSLSPRFFRAPKSFRSAIIRFSSI